MRHLIVFTFFITSNLFSQNNYLKNKELFLGADSIESKKIIAGIYIIAIDSFNIKMDLDILDDWIQKDSITEYLSIDKSSIKQNLFFIQHDSDSIPAYRYLNEKGFEIYLEKERCHESYNQYGAKYEMSCQLGIAQVYLPKNKKFYVNSLPLMYNK